MVGALGQLSICITYTSCLQILSSPDCFVPVRRRNRGPPRFFGYTKSQFLDLGVRSTSKIGIICALSILAALGAASVRYMLFIKPEKDDKKKKVDEDLLAEGRAHTSS